MIRYQLQCDHGHSFEAWFKNSTAFDRQVKRGQVSCANCGSVNVTKAIMAPSLAGRSEAKDVTVANGEAVRGSDSREAQLHALMRRLRAEVEKNADYVGSRFPEEARKIHYEEVEPRGIYGEASIEEARALKEEGVEFYPLPRLKEDHN
jgi:hypothetical protein